MTTIRVMLVDDSPLFISAMKAAIERDPRLMVAATASNGVDALALVPTVKPDVIVCDVQMPKMNGYQATKAIRKLPDERAQVPIIAMTANAFEEDRQAAFAAGMDDYLAKPIEIDKLLRKIVKVLEKK